MSMSIKVGDYTLVLTGDESQAEVEEARRHLKLARRRQAQHDYALRMERLYG